MNVRTQTHLRAHCSNWLKLTYGFRISVFFDCYFLPQAVHRVVIKSRGPGIFPGY